MRITLKLLKDFKGMNLFEVIIVLLIALIMIKAGMVFNEPANKLIDKSLKRFNALKLAESQINDLRYRANTEFSAAGGVLDQSIIDHTATLTDILPGYTLIYNVYAKDLADDGVNGDVDYKTIIVKCTYPGNNVLKVTGVVFEK